MAEGKGNEKKQGENDTETWGNRLQVGRVNKIEE